MAQGYLVEAKSFLEKAKENLLMNWNENNYQIYFPLERMLVGYFSEKDLTPSKEKFIQSPVNNDLRLSLDEKILSGKIKRSVEIDSFELRWLNDFYTNPEYGKKAFEYRFKRFVNLISQK
jgi:hypothetical protein